MTDEELVSALRMDAPWVLRITAEWVTTHDAADRIEALVKAEDRAERLEARCKALIAAYDKVHWMRTADYHGDECDCLRCHFDHLRTALKGEDK